MEIGNITQMEIGDITQMEIGDITQMEIGTISATVWGEKHIYKLCTYYTHHAELFGHCWDDHYSKLNG
jgi:hypothetical protein